MQSPFSSFLSPELQKTYHDQRLLQGVPGGNSVTQRSEVIEGGERGENKTPLLPPVHA